MSQAIDLSGGVAVVTGGSRGLGREMALAFARAGADVVVSSRKIDACEQVAAEIRAETGQRALAVAAHAGRWEDADRLCDAVYSEFGQCDILVNNAGMSPSYPSLTEVSEELFDKVMGVNLKGPFRLSSLFGARMAEGDGGSIINVSSISAVRPKPGELVYSSAKAALEALTVGFAKAYGPTVRCNTIRPGPFLTDIAKAWDLEEYAARARRSYPLQRLGEPHEVIGAALYLASDLASYTTATVITVDGGAIYQGG
jgi:NAD(P)-dependent dehydrogenase (short-subunit alcohol dehydrogenase family)